MPPTDDCAFNSSALAPNTHGLTADGGEEEEEGSERLNRQQSRAEQRASKRPPPVPKRRGAAADERGRAMAAHMAHTPQRLQSPPVASSLRLPFRLSLLPYPPLRNCRRCLSLCCVCCSSVRLPLLPVCLFRRRTIRIAERRRGVDCQVTRRILLLLRRRPFKLHRPHSFQPPLDAAALNRLPAAVTLYTAEEFLEDNDAVALGRCSRLMLSTMRQYRIKQQLLIDRVLSLRRQSGQSHESSSTAVSPSQWRIGRVMSVRIGEDFIASPEEPLSSLIAALPPSVTRLRIQCDQPLGDCSLPPSLTSLQFDGSFDQAVEQLHLPQTLTALEMSGRFQQPLSGLSLPPSLIQLHLGGWFNQPLPALPDSLQSLVLGAAFDQPLPPHPPAALQHLSIGKSRQGTSYPWTQEWNSAPLRTLHIHSPFLDIEELQFPPTLTELEICLQSDADIASKQLPASLKRLVLFHYNRYGPFRGSLALQWSADAAARVERFDLSGLDWRPDADCARLTLPRLGPAGGQMLPYGLRLADEQPMLQVDWPEDLTDLFLPHAGHQLLLRDGWLPASLRRLHLEFDPSSQLRLEDCCFPPALTQLSFGYYFSEPISAAVRWPPALQRIKLNNCFSQPLDEWQPPASLTALCLESTSYWNYPTLRCPPNLRSLQLSNSFNKPLEGLQLPQSLTHLAFGNYFRQSLQPLAALPHLQRLDLCSDLEQPLSGADWSLSSLRELRLLLVDSGFSSTLLRSLPSGLTELHLLLRSQWETEALLATLDRMLQSGELSASFTRRLFPAALLSECDSLAVSAATQSSDSATPMLQPQPTSPPLPLLSSGSVQQAPSTATSGAAAVAEAADTVSSSQSGVALPSSLRCIRGSQPEGVTCQFALSFQFDLSPPTP